MIYLMSTFIVSCLFFSYHILLLCAPATLDYRLSQCFKEKKNNVILL